jgi:hypothetical protein
LRHDSFSRRIAQPMIDGIDNAVPGLWKHSATAPKPLRSSSRCQERVEDEVLSSRSLGRTKALATTQRIYPSPVVKCLLLHSAGANHRTNLLKHVQ